MVTRNFERIVLGLLFLFSIVLAHGRGMTPLRKAQQEASTNDEWCTLCQILTKILDIGLLSNSTIDELEYELIRACSWVNYKKVDHAVCAGIIPEFGPEVVPIVVAADLTPTQICSFLKLCPKEQGPTPWKLDPLSIPPPPSYPIPSRPSSPNAAPFRVLQLSDIHYDELYAEGSPTNCNQPLCCRTNAGSGTGSAGKWGDYECDIPLATFEAALVAIAALNPPVDALIWTGDTPAHDVWEESRSGQVSRIATTSALIKKYLPNVPTFPAMGNHDTFPVDQFSRKPMDDAHYDDFDWLLSGLESLWGPWLDNTAKATLRSGGYYSASVKPGLRVIALNTQWGDNLNFYLLLKEDQRRDMFQFFVDALSTAESLGEKVMIIGHIPSVLSLDASLSSYAPDYVALASRFNETILGHFFGHTHNDELSLISNAGQPVGVTYICPSVTTFTYHNPSFRVYHLDPSSYEVLDYEQYYSSLPQANAQNRMTWQVEYTARAAYNLTDLSPQSWWDFSTQLESDQSLLNLFTQHKYTLVNPNATCDAGCKKDTLCMMRTATPDDYDKCMQ
eukprot:TRINITY_DN2452_c0_g1_i1.p1 TRINITY_DN2452_c0_g1~~TRINITY_DN2452_c0_g1_i1.p1  ORF type:complete len:562 (-),score=102.61 TRINITY_DN2452_c0_g1_i1:169-1854(-)